MKKIFLLVLAVLCAFLVTGCKSIDYGTVMDKSFTPSKRVYLPIVTRTGKTTRIIPRWVHHPDRWLILVENEENCIRIPMLSHIRSLNLSNAVNIVLYEALRQNNFINMQAAGELHRLHWKNQ